MSGASSQQRFTTFKSLTKLQLTVPAVSTGCFKPHQKSLEESRAVANGNLKRRGSIEKISTVTDAVENCDFDSPHIPEDPPPWASLLMQGIDDPNRMSFTQSLAFNSTAPTQAKKQQTTKYMDGHIALQRRLNNYAKIITVVVLALCFAFVFSYIYKSFAAKD